MGTAVPCLKARGKVQETSRNTDGPKVRSVRWKPPLISRPKGWTSPTWQCKGARISKGEREPRRVEGTLFSVLHPKKLACGYQHRFPADKCYLSSDALVSAHNRSFAWCLCRILGRAPRIILLRGRRAAVSIRLKHWCKITTCKKEPLLPHAHPTWHRKHPGDETEDAHGDDQLARFVGGDPEHI